MTVPERLTLRRRVLGAVTAVGGLLAFLASFLTWIATGTDDGGTTSIDGWGAITGSSQIAGTNLNDVLAGASTYRPGLIGLIFGAIALVAGIAVAATTQGTRPHRVTAAVLTLAGGVLTVWGGFRGLVPGDAGVLDPGEATAGAGPWVTALGGLLVLGVAAVIVVGRIDPTPPATRRRGVQPR